jgi:hypothetical protein
VLRRELVQAVVPLLSSRDLLFDVDLLVTARQLGFHILEVPTVWVDQPGSRIGVVRDSRRMAASLLRLWLHHRVLPVPTSVSAYPDDPVVVGRVEATRSVPAPGQISVPTPDAHVG